MAADRGGIPHQNDTVSERQTSGRRSVPRLWRSSPRPRTWAPVSPRSCRPSMPMPRRSRTPSPPFPRQPPARPRRSRGPDRSGLGIGKRARRPHTEGALPAERLVVHPHTEGALPAERLVVHPHTEGVVHPHTEGWRPDPIHGKRAMALMDTLAVPQGQGPGIFSRCPERPWVHVFCLAQHRPKN